MGRHLETLNFPLPFPFSVSHFPFSLVLAGGSKPQTMVNHIHSPVEKPRGTLIRHQEILADFPSYIDQRAMYVLHTEKGFHYPLRLAGQLGTYQCDAISSMGWSKNQTVTHSMASGLDFRSFLTIMQQRLGIIPSLCSSLFGLFLSQHVQLRKMCC